MAAGCESEGKGKAVLITIGNTQRDRGPKPNAYLRGKRGRKWAQRLSKQSMQELTLNPCQVQERRQRRELLCK